MWTVSVGQVGPEIPPPPHKATQISQQIYTDLRDDQKIRENAEFRGSAEDFTAW